ncbi:MAG TPA: S-layer homology domain-containing protein, partial [Chloroflexia bacterium]|nr:S-layer homology domain-containing protein [Chloroflexia bacterium]
TNTIGTIATVPRAGGETRGVVVNNQMWVLGGGRVAPNPSNEVDIYDPATDTWSLGQPFTSPRRNFTADSDPATGTVWIAGGYDVDGVTPLSSMEIFSAGGGCQTPVPPTDTPVVPTDTPVPPTNTPGGPTETATSVVGSPTETPTVCTLSFEDVPPDHTFYAYIQCLACRGIINGYPCGGPGEPCNANNDPYFRPGNNVSRGQFSKIASNSAGFNDPAGPQQYEDVLPGATFYDYIWRLTNRGLVNGYPCGGPGEPCGPDNLPYFRPASSITRGQLSKIDANAAGLTQPAGAQQYEDVLPGSTFYDYIWRLTDLGYMQGYPCGGVGEPCGPNNLPYFRPSANATRGQASKIVANTFFPECGALSSNR